MNSIDPARIGFRPVTPDDYPLLQSWMARPHWREWWGDPETELGYVREMVERRDTTRPFIFLLDGMATGYIQAWAVGDHLGEPWISRAPWMKQSPADSVGVDLAIGKTADLSRGIGAAVLRAFAHQLVAEGHRTIIIDPDAGNSRAIRAYEKAGFRQLLVAPAPDGKDERATLVMQWEISDGRAKAETMP